MACKSPRPASIRSSANWKVGPEVRRAFEEAFGPFDQSLVLREVFERVDELIRELSFSRALMLLAEAGIDPAQSSSEGSRQRLGAIVGRLAALGARMRDPELAALVNWLEQVIEHQRSLEEGRKLATFLLHEVEAPLRKRLEATGDAGSLDWFAYALHRWALTASNHLGDLVGGRVAAAKLDELTPALAQRWEHAPLLMQGMIAQAVHRTDCFAYDDVSARMKLAPAQGVGRLPQLLLEAEHGGAPRGRGLALPPAARRGRRIRALLGPRQRGIRRGGLVERQLEGYRGGRAATLRFAQDRVELGEVPVVRRELAGLPLRDPGLREVPPAGLRVTPS